MGGAGLGAGVQYQEGGLRLASASWLFYAGYGYANESAKVVDTDAGASEAVARTLVRLKALAAAARLLIWEDMPRARRFAEEKVWRSLVNWATGRARRSTC